MNQGVLKSLFDYDPITGRLVRVVFDKPGQKAITHGVSAQGYYVRWVNQECYLEHVLVYLWHTGEFVKEIDHENRVKTDNRIENLRPATSTQNKGNIGLLRSNQSGFRGVSLNRRSMKWHAQIKVMGKQTYLGRFDTPEEAAATYNHAARLYFGEFAHLNDV